MKNYACHRLYISPSVYIKMATLTIDKLGQVRKYDTLQTENPFTEWIGGIIFLSNGLEIIRRNTLRELLEENMQPTASPVYAWHISHYNFTNEQLTPQSIIQRLI